MIEVNLLPTRGKKRSRRGGRSFKFALPNLPDIGGDRWLIAVIAVAVVTLGAAAWFWFGVSSERSQVQADLEQAVQDSARYADLISQTTELEARRDSILERVAVIQEIDRDRLIWPHVLDEVARALPEYTWLTELTTISSSPLVFQLIGRAGNTRAITLFMEQLQASPFVRSVRLITTQGVVENQNTPQQQVVQSFELEVEHRTVPLEELSTVPLFAVDEVDSGTSGAPPEVVDDALDASDAPPPEPAPDSGQGRPGPVPDTAQSGGGETWR